MKCVKGPLWPVDCGQVAISRRVLWAALTINLGVVFLIIDVQLWWPFSPWFLFSFSKSVVFSFFSLLVIFSITMESWWFFLWIKLVYLLKIKLFTCDDYFIAYLILRKQSQYKICCVACNHSEIFMKIFKSGFGRKSEKSGCICELLFTVYSNTFH